MNSFIVFIKSAKVEDLVVRLDTKPGTFRKDKLKKVKMSTEEINYVGSHISYHPIDYDYVNKELDEKLAVPVMIMPKHVIFEGSKYYELGIEGYYIKDTDVVNVMESAALKLQLDHYFRYAMEIPKLTKEEYPTYLIDAIGAFVYGSGSFRLGFFEALKVSFLNSRVHNITTRWDEESKELVMTLHLENPSSFVGRNCVLYTLINELISKRTSQWNPEYGARVELKEYCPFIIKDLNLEKRFHI